MRDEEDITLIYVIRHEHGYVKIGKSDAPKDRLKSLQTACPYDLEIHTTITVYGEWGVVENAIHEFFEGSKIQGEWFDISERLMVMLDDIREIDSMAVSQLDNWTPKKHFKYKSKKRNAAILDGCFSK